MFDVLHALETSHGKSRDSCRPIPVSEATELIATKRSVIAYGRISRVVKDTDLRRSIQCRAH
jgi:hypothetical protein